MSKPWDILSIEGSPRICVQSMGKGPLLIFLHGIGGNKMNWDLQLPVFSEFFKSVAWDSRGYGQSDDYEGELDFSDFSHDLLRVLDRFGKEKAHLCGLSMGGRIAQDFYALYPDRVSSLVLCDTFAGDDTKDPRSGRSQSIEEFVEIRIRPFLDGATPLEQAQNRGGSLLAPGHSEDAKQRSIEASAQLHVESYIKTVRASAKFSRVDNLKNIDVPTLLVFGELDPLTPPTVGEYMQDRIPDAKLVIIKGAGHMTNLEKPEVFNKAVLEFLLEI